jgi:hypothetical protein
MTFTIPYCPPSGNVIIRRDRDVRWKQERKQVIAMLIVAAIGQPEYPMDEKRKRLAITVYRSRLIDQTNLRAGVKWLEDALVRLGWLVDDSPEWVQHEDPVQVKCRKGQERTEIVLEPVE